MRRNRARGNCALLVLMALSTAGEQGMTTNQLLEKSGSNRRWLVREVLGDLVRVDIIHLKHASQHVNTYYY